MKKLSNSDAEFKKNVTFIAEPSGEYPERNFADDTQTEKTKKKTIKHGVSGLPNSYSFTIFIQNRRL